MRRCCTHVRGFQRAWMAVVLLMALALPVVGAHRAQAAASLTVDGAQRFQTMDGFGVSVNSASWKGGELKPAIDLLVDQNGSTIWRVVIDNTDWEAVNDDGDPGHFNWAYYEPIYTSRKFQDLWSTIAYLNSKGITKNLIISLMGPGPAWMGGGTLTARYQDEWVEMTSSLAYYARNTMHVQFGIYAPDNEPDWDCIEGICQDATLFASSMAKLSEKLDSIGLSDVRLIGPDTAGHFDEYLPPMLAEPALMAKVDHLAMHDYNGNTGGALEAMKASDYPNVNLWMTEFSRFSDTMSLLSQGASALLTWDGYDSVYNHPLLHGAPPTPPNDAGNAPALLAYDETSGVYTPRNEFYQFAQLYKFVPPNSVRIGASSSSGSLSTVAFHDPASGRLTIVGSNTSTASESLTISLRNLGAPPSSFAYYQTNSSSEMARGADVLVAGSAASMTVPASTIFTLTGVVASGPDVTPPAVTVTAPANGSTVSGTIAVSSNATDDVGVAGVQFELDGSPLGAEDATSPYDTTWDTTTVVDGSHTLTVVARDGAGNVATAGPTTVTVGNAPVRDTVLLGSQTVGGNVDSNLAGLAEAFTFTAARTGQADSISLYVDAGSSATSVVLGLYATNGGHPGSLLASATMSSPSVGWNTAVLSAAPSLSAGEAYSIAVVGFGGQLVFRDASSGNCSETPGASLSALSAIWESGQSWPTCTLSAYVMSAGVSAAPTTFTAADPPLTGTVGGAYSYVFAATGSPTPTFALASGAPSWLSIDPASGLVAGTPPAGTTSFAYRVIASNGVDPDATTPTFTVIIVSVRDTVLLGSQTVGGNVDSNLAGLAEAFTFTAARTGQADSISLYVDAGSSATSVVLGLYATNGGHPGSLLASATMSSPSVGWNTAVLSAAPSLSAGEAYSIAVVGFGGQLVFRDTSSGNCSETPGASLSALSAIWESGQSWPTCTLSAYVMSAAPTITAADRR